MTGREVYATLGGVSKSVKYFSVAMLVAVVAVLLGFIFTGRPTLYSATYVVAFLVVLILIMMALRARKQDQLSNGG